MEGQKLKESSYSCKRCEQGKLCNMIQVGVRIQVHLFHSDSDPASIRPDKNGQSICPPPHPRSF